MSKFERDIIASLKDAAAHARGEATGARVTVIRVPDVRAIRKGLDMSQSEFADAYQIPLPTLQGWEQRRRHPDRIATAYLKIITRLPMETRAAFEL